MAKASRDKGIRFELEVAKLFQEFGFDVNRVPNSGGLRLKGDLYGNLDGYHLEAKRAERLDIPGWLRQARDEASPGIVPIVAFRRSHEIAYAALPLRHFVSLLAEARDLGATHA